MEGLAGVMIFVWLFGFVLLIAWIALPFAMFGIKPLLRELIAATNETNRLLRLDKDGSKGNTKPWTSPER
jgi:hypothetical protein